MASKKRVPRLVDPAGIQDLRELSIVEVTWQDAAANSVWMEFEELRKQAEGGLMNCQTVGYLIKVDKTAVILSATRAANGKLAGDWSIPRKWIQSIKVIRK